MRRGIGYTGEQLIAPSLSKASGRLALVTSYCNWLLLVKTLGTLLSRE
jgi:hypothetical protein